MYIAYYTCTCTYELCIVVEKYIPEMAGKMGGTSKYKSRFKGW